MPGSRVLVVDDDRMNCEVVARLLSDRGYMVDVANDGSEALELIARNPYSLVVLDYLMPGMNGVELFRRARQLQPELLGVFFTAYANINTVFPAIEAGVDRVLAKPVDARELIPWVEQMIGPGDPKLTAVGAKSCDLM